MPLNVVSNYAANVAHRNLTMTDAQASSSLAKLSIGQRVISARDDAASMAIGSRMNSEVQSLKQAVVNAGQANAMLQIADGAMSTVSDILTRMKTLAVQASSGNLSDTERGFLDIEFQNLVGEIDRVAQDTDFNGFKLLDGSITVTPPGGFAAVGIASFSAQGVSTGGFTMEFTSDTIAEAYIFSVTTADGLYQGAINTEAVDVDTAGVATLNRTTTLTLTSGVGPGSITIKLDGTSGTPFDPAASIAADTTGDFAGSTQLSLSFKLGSGTEAEDSLSFSLDGVSASALGLDSHEIVSAGQAGDAVTQINTALDNLNGYRAKVGASQNRLDFAASNLRVSIENAEAARSNLLDLDIAQEMTNFTSKQVLLQSGVAMLAQANQMPQNLLRLLQ